MTEEARVLGNDRVLLGGGVTNVADEMLVVRIDRNGGAGAPHPIWCGGLGAGLNKKRTLKWAHE